MGYYVYILKSEVVDRYYIGSTQDIKNRLMKHNQGYVRSTKGYRPWVLIYKEEHQLRQQAVKRELQIKSFKRGEAFKRLIG